MVKNSSGFLLVLLAVFLFVCNIKLQAQANNADSIALILLNQQTDTWVVQKNLAALDSIYAKDFRFSHGSGKKEGKAGWLTTVGRANYSLRRHDSVTAELHPGLAILRGKMSIEKINKTKTDRYQLHYVRVYHLRHKSWQMISHITTHEQHE